MATQKQRVAIVGGVAGGASAAARLRRLNDAVQIDIYDRGDFVSFANCGLPYFIGNVIHKQKELVVATPELFRDRFNVNVHLHQQVDSIDPQNHKITITDLPSGQQREEHFDKLVLSPGARPIKPPLPGLDLPGVFCVRTIPDAAHIKTWIQEHNVQSAVVIGAGFIGLEMAENLHALGVHVTLLEKSPQILPVMDEELTQFMRKSLLDKGIEVVLNDGLSSVENKDGEDGFEVVAESGKRLPAQLAVLSIGVLPESTLARNAGIDLGGRGAIKVDAHMRTSVTDVWAVGDAVETTSTVTGGRTSVPLAGPANRQGRVAARSIANSLAGLDPAHGPGFRGVQGTAVCGAFGVTMAMTGLSERLLRRAMPEQEYKAVYAHPGHHVGYYPGAKKLHLKMLFSPRDGRIFGAQAVGEVGEGVARRIDTIAMCMQMNGTVQDLAESELCYAPQYGAAKDPANLLGMIASNVCDGLVELEDWSALTKKLDPLPFLLLDCRTTQEFARDGLPQAINIPVNELRTRIGELPRDKPVAVMCESGQRAYNACRFLTHQDYVATLLSGGMATHRVLCPDY